jgi:sulfur transfer complex TusBCD TusB component (DsrH family)
MPKVWDVFMLSGELDMLECHLREYEGRGIQHVLVEAPYNHQGYRKPLHYAENKSRFARWGGSITHLVDTEMPTVAQNPDPWSRELHQRDFAMRGLAGSAQDDVIIVGDVDELLSPEALDIACRGDFAEPYLGVNVNLLFCAADWMGTPGVMPCIARRGAVYSLNKVREMREAHPRVCGDEPAGWHLSWFGGPDAIRYKANSFCHLEARQRNLDLAEDMYARGWTDYAGAGAARPVDPDETWPKWVWASWDAQRRRRRSSGPAPEIWFRPR